MQKVLQRMGKAILKIACLIGVGLLQFLYNITYITGAQTLRILKRLEKRVDRFLYPLRDLCHRIYLRFFRKKLRMAHYSRVKIRSNLRWESDNLQAVRQKHGIRSAISHFWQARQHRAILSAVGHVVFPLVALLVLGGTIWFWNQQTYGLYLSYGEGESAVVADEGVFDEASEMMNQRMMFETATATEINTVASYRLGIMEETQFTDASVICDNLIRSSDDVISDACGVYINGELGGVVRSSTDLRYVLETLLREEKEKSEALSADYLESLEIVSGLFPTSSILSTDVLRQRLETKLHICVVKEETVEEEIPYKTVTQKDDSQYTDYSKVIQEGESGLRTCVDRVSYVEGEEVSREEISQEVTKEAVNRIVVVGTKKRPTGKIPGEASGIFTWPSPIVRNISSYYGARWGTTHWGLDFSNGNSYGQTIVAADGGTVSYVKLHNYGYGYHLLIDHGNGYQTMYAHASKILVSSGEKVAKGQPIALIGSTGDSTGAHLHFEIIKNGEKVDPLPYLTSN